MWAAIDRKEGRKEGREVGMLYSTRTSAKVNTILYAQYSTVLMSKVTQRGGFLVMG